MFESNEVVSRRRMENKAELLKSKVLAKAILKTVDGSLLVLAVHKLSTTYEFFWQYQLDSKSPRAPRKKWLRGSATAKIVYKSFGAFVENTTKLKKSEILSIKIYNKKALESIMVKCHKDSIGTNWHEAPQSVTALDFRIVNQKSLNKRRGTVAIGWGK